MFFSPLNAIYEKINMRDLMILYHTNADKSITKSNIHDDYSIIMKRYIVIEQVDSDFCEVIIRGKGGKKGGFRGDVVYNTDEE